MPPPTDRSVGCWLLCGCLSPPEYFLSFPETAGDEIVKVAETLFTCKLWCSTCIQCFSYNADRVHRQQLIKLHNARHVTCASKHAKDKLSVFISWLLSWAKKHFSYWNVNVIAWSTTKVICPMHKEQSWKLSHPIPCEVVKK